MPVDTRGFHGPNLPVIISQRHAVPFRTNADRVPRLMQNTQQHFLGSLTESQKQEEEMEMGRVLEGHS